jgi:hypothetical protein
MTTKTFLTFGGPSSNYHSAVHRICTQASELNVFHNIVGITDHHLKDDKEFYDKHGRFLEENSRGYGYWLWKSYVVKKQLEKMNENDILLYADSGCVLNINGKKRLHEYFDMVQDSEYGIVSFQMGHIEKKWTKMDIFKHFDAYDYLETGQLVGGIFLIRKCEHSVNLVNTWYETCHFYDLINDSPSIENNHPDFSENRHDQSVWSIIRKKYGTYIIPSDETYFANWSDGNDYPILAMRQKY